MNPGQGTNFQGWHFLAFNFCSMLFHLLLPILAEENNHLDLVVCTPLRSQELYFSDWYKSFLSIEVVLGYIPLVLECSFGNSKQVIFVELLRILYPIFIFEYKPYQKFSERYWDSSQINKDCKIQVQVLNSYLIFRLFIWIALKYQIHGETFAHRKFGVCCIHQAQAKLDRVNWW